MTAPSQVMNHTYSIRQGDPEARSGQSCQKLLRCPAVPAVSPVAHLQPLVYQTKHAVSLFRSYEFSDTPTGTWKKVVCRQLTSGSPFNSLRNKRQAENGQTDHQHQSATADQQYERQSLSAVLWQSYMYFVRRLCIR